MAKHDIVVLNTTSSGFETNLGDNIARIKGDGDDLFSVRDSSGSDKLAVSSVEQSLILNVNVTSSGHLSGSGVSASFGRVDVTNLTGDASLMTNVNEIGHISSSQQLSAAITGAFTHGFTLEGENRVVSGSVTSTGSFTRVFATDYSGDASDLFDVNEDGHFSSSAQLAADISGSFNQGFEFVGTISGSSTSTGSFGRVRVTGNILGDASEVTINQDGHFSSSAQLATDVSGSFSKGFELSNNSLIGGITPAITTTKAMNLPENDDWLRMIDPGPLEAFDGDDAGHDRFIMSMWFKFNSTPTQYVDHIFSSGAGSWTWGGIVIFVGYNGGDDLHITFQVPTAGVGDQSKYGGYYNTMVYNAQVIGKANVGQWQNVIVSYDRHLPPPGSNLSAGDTGVSVSSGSAHVIVNGVTKGVRPVASGSLIGGYARSGAFGAYYGHVSRTTHNSDITVGDFTLWKHSFQSASNDSGIDSGSMISSLFNRGIIPDYTSDYATDYPTPLRNNIAFSFNFDSSSYDGGDEFTFYDRTNQGTYSLVSDGTPQTALVSGSDATPRTGVGPFFDTTSSFTETLADVYSGDANQVTGVNSALVSGTVTGSGQLAQDISGSFTSGFEVEGTISGSSTSTGSFTHYVFGEEISIGDVSDIEGQPSSDGFISSSAQLAADISGSFNKGFGIANRMSGSVSSTGSFSKIDANVYSGDASQVTGFTLPSGLASGSAGFASRISGSIRGGFTLAEGAVITASVHFISTSLSSSTEEVYAGQSSIISVSESVQSASFSVQQSNFLNINVDNITEQRIFHSGVAINKEFPKEHERHISGSITGLPRFRSHALISGSATSTGSYAKLRAESITIKDVVGDVRKPISGSTYNHDNYTSGSFRPVATDKPIKIPVRGRVDHTLISKQFIATGSMENQKYRTQHGQLFVDNWGRLNMTVQTGSMVQQPAAWTLVGSGEALGGRYGGMIAQSTKAALVLPSQGMAANCTRIFDGITIFGGANLPYNISYCGWSHGYQGIGNGANDALQAGAGFGGGTGCNASIYDGSAWASSTKLVENLHSSNGQPKAFNAPGVTTGGGGALIGGTNKNKVYEWTGVSWEIGGTRNVNIGGGGAAGTVYAGVAFGGKEYPSPAASTCTEEYNGISWASATAMPHELDSLGAGTQNAAVTAGGGTVAPHQHGPYLQSNDTFEYNGTSWYSGPDMLSYMSQHGMAGGTGTLISGPGLGGWSNGIGAIYEPAFVTGSENRYNNFQPSTNGDGRYLLTKKLQANYISSTGGGTVTSGSSGGYGGGY